jgi:hypothetical protein
MFPAVSLFFFNKTEIVSAKHHFNGLIFATKTLYGCLETGTWLQTGLLFAGTRNKLHLPKQPPANNSNVLTVY